MAQQYDGEWYEQAACQGLGWKPFFDTEEALGARRVCATCPVRTRCLQFAIDNAVTTGIWGGLTPLERRHSLLPQA